MANVEVPGASQGDLNRKALPASAGTCGIRIDELKALAIQSVRKIQRGAQQVKQAFLVDEDFYSLVFEYLIGRIDLVVEVEIIH